MLKFVCAMVGIVCLLASASMGCSSDEGGNGVETGLKSETPTEAARAILKLYRERDFDTLVRSRYAEIAKAENEAQIESLVERFATRFDGEEALEEAISVYEGILTKSPQFTEGGRVARFHVEGGFVKLSRMANGRWGFHL